MKGTLRTMLSASIPLFALVSTTSAQAATTTALTAIQTLSCYKDVAPLVKFGSDQYMTPGKCQEDCGKDSSPQHAVMAIIGGDTCYCGDIIPSLDKITANSSCSQPCNGYGTMTCGGMSTWQVYLTGLTGAVQTAPNSTSSTSSSSSPTSASPTVVTQSGQTVVVTASSTASPAASHGSSKVGIAVGVVMGVVVVAAATGGLFFYLKQRRIRAIEEEHRRNATQAGFGNVSQTSETQSTSDSRLDTSIFSHRRESVGSIADERDFSRRILQVRNPDHRASGASNFA